MASTSLVRTAFVCANCRRTLSTLRAPPLHTFPQRSSGVVQIQTQRPFHQYNRLASEKQNAAAGQVSDSDPKQEDWTEERQLTDLEKLEASFADESKTSKGKSSSKKSSVPWYLEEQNSQQQQQHQAQELQPEAANPFLERQRMPDLPSDPPPIIQPLLSHLSVDLGLDYVTILDLRALDPPPALGANLLMLFGSARSEKHLNVSADRLCRWLRGNYKLRPLADGLLGRNELKLKMRRKNRRAKMMSAAGAAYNSDPDDGITTGWICVNVGSVENGPEANKRLQTATEAPDFVGFGPSQDPAKIVVQILTEEKRNELDLETLWQDALDTTLRRKAGAQRALEKELASQDSQADADDTPAQTTISSVNGSQSPARRPFGSAFQQVRHFHNAPPTYSPSAPATIQQTQPTSHGQAPTTETAETISDKANDMELNPAVDSPMQKLEDFLAHSSPSTAAAQLGQHEDDRTSTPFLRSFYADFPVIPEPAHLLAEFHLHCHGLILGNRNFTPPRLLERLHQLQACGTPIPEQTFHLALEATFIPYYTQSSKSLASFPERLGRSMTGMLQNALGVLYLMEANGHDVRSPRVLTTFSNALEAPNFNTLMKHADQPTPTLPPKRHEFYRFLFTRALEELAASPGPNDTTTTNTPLYTHLMTSYLKTNPASANTNANTNADDAQWRPDPDFPSFWNLWHQLPRSLVRRTPQMYALMFEAVARAGPASKCQTELMRRFPEMGREVPPVRCDEPVAGAVLVCLQAAGVSRADAPWRAMWEAAERGLQRGRAAAAAAADA